MKRLLFTIGICSSLAFAVHAEVYKSVDSEGNIVFSDTPSKGAEEVRLPPIMTYSAPKLPARSSSEAKNTELDNNHYQSLTVTEPLEEATIRDNTGTVIIKVKLEPPLRAELGHRMQFMLDGTTQGAPGLATGATFSNLDRGSHTLSAQIQDEKGEVLIQAKPVTVFVHRISVNSGKP